MWFSFRKGELTMKNFRNPFILGVFTGCMLTTIGYVMVSSTFSLTWNGRRELLDPREVQYYEALLPSVDNSEVPKRLEFEDRGFQHLRTIRSKQQKLQRGVLLSVIASPVAPVKAVYERVATTWGKGKSNWKVMVGAKAPFTHEKVLNSDCGDFPASGDSMSPRQLFCLVEKVYSLYQAQYQWFFFATKSVYVSMSYLERLLNKLDPDNGIAYLGRPHVEQNYCVGGSGIVVSHTTLSVMVSLMESCLEEADVISSSGDAFLGACMEQNLHASCSLPGQSHGYFANNFHGFGDSPSEWQETYPNFVTVSPVASLSDMHHLRALELMREQAFYLKMSEEKSEGLYTAPFCTHQHTKLGLEAPQPTNELMGWTVVNPNSTYYSDRLEPREWYDGQIRLEIEMVARRAIQDMNRQYSTNFSLHRIVYSLFRSVGTHGRELIIDIETQSKEIKHFHLLRPFNLDPLIMEDAGDEAMDKTVDFVVPLSNVHSRFAEFMKNYENLCLQVNENCRLNLVIYGKDDYKVIEANLTEYKTRYPHAQFNLIHGTGKFSRGRALHQGIATLQKSDLAFTCDVDMTIDRNFLNRCRRNAIQGRRVYYPAVFKYYDMDYVYRFEEKPLFGYDISRKHGHWCTYGYGMLCIYKSDYDETGGYDVKIEGWGGEDIKLADRVIKYGYEVMRAPDPALSHRHHPKICSKSLSKSQYSQCLSSRNEDIADRRRLADYIYYLENKCNVKKKIWD